MIATSEHIVLESVHKRFGHDVAADDVSLTIGRGEFFSLLGPSGCGKTTTLRIVAGFAQPDAGRVLIAGDDVTSVPPQDRKVNMVFQAYALFPHLSVHENVAFGLRRSRIRGGELRRRVGEALDSVQLSGLAGRKPHELSGGQQQRVALARALVNRPAAVLLDEPLAALDVALRRDMQRQLKEIQRRSSTTFVMVTHDQEEALVMSDRVAVMNAGRVLQIGPSRDLFERPGNDFVAGFLGSTNIIDLRVDAADEGGCRMVLGDGQWMCAPVHARVGERVRISLRPNHVRLDPGDAENGARIRVQVADIEYRGSLTEVRLLRPDGSPLTAHVLSTTRPGPRVGDEVTVGWAAADVHPLQTTSGPSATATAAMVR